MVCSYCRAPLGRALVLVGCVSWFISVGTIWSADWPQFRGPNRTNVSDETNLLQEWPANGPPVVWTATGLGEGFSSISVAGERIYSMGDKGDRSCIFALTRA